MYIVVYVDNVNVLYKQVDATWLRVYHFTVFKYVWYIYIYICLYS